ncbi:MAG: cbb3-type cytochrome c oxidase N-terminal domain-containing protein [Rubripirellula sp.]|nr:cbb3-type cytochrome c oxidase N-terminal domain-containing protein [Rubripirellula sp.]
MNEPVNEPNTASDNAPDDQLTGHDYDGIQEYDNPLPGWWKWLFIVSILFGPPYFFFYHNGVEGRSLSDRYDRNLAANLRLQFDELGDLKADRAAVIKYTYQPNWLKAGKAVFKTHCVSCHGKDGGGLIGPNLTDEAYKNVKDIGDILSILQNGANAGAMPAWQNRLSTPEIVLVSSYVASLRGTTPSTEPKEPEGRPIPPWPGPPAEEQETETADASEDNTESTDAALEKETSNSESAEE